MNYLIRDFITIALIPIIIGLMTWFFILAGLVWIIPVVDSPVIRTEGVCSFHKKAFTWYGHYECIGVNITK